MKANETLWDAFFFYWDVYYWIQNGSGRFVGCRGKRTADKTNQRSERDYVPLCGLAGISLCKILSSSDAHMTSVSAKPAEVCLDEKSFTTNELLVPFLQNSERNGFLKEQKGCRVTLQLQFSSVKAHLKEKQSIWIKTMWRQCCVTSFPVSVQRPATLCRSVLTCCETERSLGPPLTVVVVVWHNQVADWTGDIKAFSKIPIIHCGTVRRVGMLTLAVSAASLSC